jgi:hypothetical protein
MLIFADDLNNNKKNFEEFKRSLVSSGNYDVEKLYNSNTSETTSDIDDPNADYDFSGVAWESPTENDFVEFEKLQELLSDTTVSVPENNTVESEWF